MRGSWMELIQEVSTRALGWSSSIHACRPPFDTTNRATTTVIRLGVGNPCTIEEYRQSQTERGPNQRAGPEVALPYLMISLCPVACDSRAALCRMRYLDGI